MKYLDILKLKKFHKAHQKTRDFSRFLNIYRQNRKLSFKNLLGIEDLTDNDLRLVLEMAWLFKYELLEKGFKKFDFLKGKSIINFFGEESTRTRSSFELAGKHLGADIINVSASTSSMKKKKESLFDTVRTLNKLKADGVIVRDAHALSPHLMAEEISAPLINAGDGWHEHPTQGLLDALTMLEEFNGNLKNKTIAVVGDIVHSRVAGSLIRIANRLDMNVRLVAPPTMIPKEVEKVFKVKVYHEMEKGIKVVDVIYVLRIQLERAAASYIPTVRDYSKLYCVNQIRLPLANKNVIVMHAGPINREIDMATQVMESKHSRVEEQVTNGLAVRLALLYLMIN